MADSCRVIQTFVGGSSETGVDYGSTVTQTETAPVSPPVTGNEGLNDVRNTQLSDAAGDLSVEILKVEQQQDSVITRIMGLLTGEIVESDWAGLADANEETHTYFAQRQTLEVRNGLLYRQFQNSDGTIRNFQAVIPASLRTSILSHIHGSRLSGHLG